MSTRRSFLASTPIAAIRPHIGKASAFDLPADTRFSDNVFVQPDRPATPLGALAPFLLLSGVDRSLHFHGALQPQPPWLSAV